MRPSAASPRRTPHLFQFGSDPAEQAKIINRHGGDMQVAIVCAAYGADETRSLLGLAVKSKNAVDSR